MAEEAPAGVVEPHELEGTYEVYSTADGERVVGGLSKQDANAEAERLQNERDKGIDGNEDPQPHGTEALASTYAVPAGLNAQGEMQYNEMQHDPPLEKPEPREYAVRPWAAQR